MSSFLRAATGDVVGITTDKYPNGKTKISMPYNINGELNGKAKEFYENGQIASETTYENGIRQGKSMGYLENGKVIEEKNYVDGKKEGKALETFEGMIQMKTNYKNNKIDGAMFLYYPSGKLLQKRNFINGKAEHCSPTGIPMIVMHHRQPVSSQDRPLIHPPNINHNTFPRHPIYLTSLPALLPVSASSPGAVSECSLPAVWLP